MIFRRTIEKDVNQVARQVKRFKTLVVFLKIYEDAVSTVLLAAKSTTILPALFSLYAVVRIGGVVAIFAGMYAVDAILMVEIMLNLIAQVWTDSVNWRAEMMKCVGERRSLLAKEVRSLKAIRVRIGGLYYVDKGLVLTVLEVLALNSINILLLNP